MSLVCAASLPSFTSTSLPDSSPLSKAAELIVSSLSRPSSDTALLTRALEAALPSHSTVASLRAFTDVDLYRLNIPALARVYLKALMRQSVRTLSPGATSSGAVGSGSGAPWGGDGGSGSGGGVESVSIDPLLLALQRDFNHSLPIDLAPFQTSLTTLVNMGFLLIEALEALLVTDNKGPEKALTYLFADKKTREMKREEAKVRIGKCMPLLANSPFDGLSPKERSVATKTQTIANFKEFVRGILAHDRLTKRAYEQLKSEREKRKLSAADFMTILKEIGINEKQWEKLRKERFDKMPSAEALDLDCVVCLDSAKSFVLLPCAHLCMCLRCTEEWKRKEKMTCPMCSENVEKFMRVFI